MSQVRLHSGAVSTKNKSVVQARGTAEYEGLLDIAGVEMYRIPAYDQLAPFMMTITSSADHWMYVSSFGGLTAGRRDAEHALFPYETEDCLHHVQGITGPVTLIRAEADGKKILWEPFNHRQYSNNVSRSIYKTVLSDRVLFEEIHKELELTFRYQWACSPQFGFVRSATLINNRPARKLRIEILDGLLNILPACVPLALQQTSSCLVDAYKRSEWDGQMAIYSLSSIITDRPEPGECLKATIAWARGLPSAKIVLSEGAVARFREGQAVATSTFHAGQRGAFLLHADFDLLPGMQIQWDIVADVDQDHAAIGNRRHFLLHEKDIGDRIATDIHHGRAMLLDKCASADAGQLTADLAASAHHSANVLFNNLRGGVPVDQYTIASTDFSRFLQNRNREAAVRCADFLQDLPAKLSLRQLIEKADRDGDVDLRRLAREYLPLTLSRRHGDPSRPWNRFSIRSQNEDGSPAIHYEGNWRDIFQNWEGLALSFPELTENFIAKFVNASTVDGFNPYRLSDAGIDWERHDPADPWSNIGYWGDHQIIYLLKFLEISMQHYPQSLPRLLTDAIFSYANVPYRIKPYKDLIADPRRSIVFDHEMDRKISDRANKLGADGKSRCDAAGGIYHVNLLEKLLVPMLAKMSNLVLAGGIWMNTQRPEWNDANNALAGFGLSMVTLYYLRRYVQFMLDLLKPMAERPAPISHEVLNWLNNVGAALLKHSDLLRQSHTDDMGRRRLLDDLGVAFDVYRQSVYAHGFSGKVSCPIAEILPMLRLALSYLDYSIDASRRADGLYHAYNVLRLHDSSAASVEPLQLMLEGQVAVLSSGKIDSDLAIEILESLFASLLYRADQHSFLLYPLTPTKSFVSRNHLDAKEVESNPLLSALVRAGERSIIITDAAGDFHFNSGFSTAADLNVALDVLKMHPQWSDQVKISRQTVLELYEQIFHHHHFTGRSGVMHAYEGIGSVYWHMIGKLLVAAQECYWQADQQEQPIAQRRRLAELYYQIRDGLGFNKTAGEYGAFPTDPHSHTPANGGARQPGMTGQVKEEIIRRFGELGIRIENGKLRFRPALLRRREFLLASATFQSMRLEIGSLGFMYCGVPIVYRLVEGSEIRIQVIAAEGVVDIAGDSLDIKQSRRLFARDGTIQRIDVDIPDQIIQFE
jgi:hypothetical protein